MLEMLGETGDVGYWPGSTLIQVNSRFLGAEMLSEASTSPLNKHKVKESERCFKVVISKSVACSDFL